MKIKVCGMRDPENIRELGELSINYMGLIFYPRSGRYAEVDGDGSSLVRDLTKLVPGTIKRVGVFVDASIEEIGDKIEKYGLGAVQLHGGESVEMCGMIAQKGVEVIKAINVENEDDFGAAERYENVCDYILFDTKTPQHGGSGEKFDWRMLDAYSGKLPFFLSGGIGIDDAVEVCKISHPKLYGVDINSRFENATAVKNIEKLRRFIEEIKTIKL